MVQHINAMALEIASSVMLAFQQGKLGREVGADEIEAAMREHSGFHDLTDYEKEMLSEATFERFVLMVG